MPRRLLPLLLLAVIGLAAILVGAGSVAADASRDGSAASLKGSSCADPYEAHFGQPQFGFTPRLLGDTYYIAMHHHDLPRPDNNTAPFRRAYTWHGLHGAHICRFHVWVTEEYRVGETSHYEPAVLLETALDSHRPTGGTNVAVSFKYRCGPIVCKERDGKIEYHEVLTAAR